MGLEAVKDEILNSAKSQAAGLIAEARKESNRIIKSIENKIEGMKEINDTQIKKIIDSIKKQESASAELENKKMLLEAKKQIIDKVFFEARKKIEGLADKKSEAIVKKLLEKAKNEIEIATIYCNKKDAKFLKGFNVESVSVIGGIIAENKEKTVRIDYSFETILQSITENELQSVNKILFA